MLRIPAVSVIVPVYNTEKYLSRCIDSLVNQTLSDIEIILVNDASPDNSISIMQKYAAEYPDRIKLIDSKVNLRQGGARNLGINAAKGEYIGFVDSDDWVKPNMYECLYNKTLQTKFDIVGCNYTVVKDGTAKIFKQYTGSELSDDLILDPVHKKGLLTKCWSVFSSIYRRELIVDNQIFFPEKLFYEDNYWVPLVFFVANSFSFVKQSLYYYNRDNATSTTARTNSFHHLDRLKISRLLRGALIKKDVDAKYRDEIEYLYIMHNYISTENILVTKYSKIDYKLISGIRDEFLQIYPQYYRNQYYKRYHSLWKRYLFRLNDKNVYIYVSVYLLLRFSRRFLGSIKHRVST